MIQIQPRLLRTFFTTAALLLGSISLNAQTSEELMKQADALDQQLRAKEALELYQQIEKQDPKNADVLVRIARQYRHLMADTSSKSEKLRLGNLALDYGRRAAALAPKDSDAQLSTAISQGKMLPLLGTREQMEASKQIKASADKAIRLNPNNDLAWHIAGRWHRVLADISPIKRTLASIVYEKLPSATNEEAVACFKKAIAINPSRVIHYIEIGRAYDQMGRADDARAYLKKGLAMPSKEKDDAEAKLVGRQTLAKLN
jgi:tetratricopeptide (TPR) repeat protein